jgi:hypothetical protein
MKLNVLLGVTDHLAKIYKGNVVDYIKFFKGSQGSFKGERKTYTAKDGTIDDPSKRGNVLVVTTVAEKLAWLSENSAKYINALFSQEATNASGTAKAPLIVDGVKWGDFSTLELLKLKSLLDSEDLKNMYATLPVRADNKTWEVCSNPTYANRAIWQTPEDTGTSRTTIKEPYILPDPNCQPNSPGYKPQVMQRDIPQDLGTYTRQEYSGEILHVERANMLLRAEKLRVAVVEALKVANEVEAIQSGLTSDLLFNWINAGTQPVA